MKYGIIGAMEEEVEYLQSKMTEQTTYEVANSTFVEGKLGDTPVVLLQSGIGKVNAAMATTILIERFQPTFVINTGSAGGFDPTLRVGDIVISSEVVHHDVDATGFDYVMGQVPQMPPTFKADATLVRVVKDILAGYDVQSKIGLIGTGDSFINDSSRVKRLLDDFPNMLAAEMEGAAIAQVCYQYDIPFVIIRALSDIAGTESPVTFNEFLQVAANNAANLIIDIIEDKN